MKRAAALLGVALAACSSDPEEAAKQREVLLNPETCKECHQQHYEEWAGSMHAYAADDPVFLAMNERGQRETDGELGDFCVNCHAPMAVRAGLTEGGLGLGDVPQHLKGVTCYFCHNVESVEGTHNNPLVLFDDTTMRGNIVDPVENPVHDSAYSRKTDGRTRESAEMCGSCHDIEVPASFSGASEDVALERTFKEWKETLFSTDERFLSCAGCHMQGSRQVPIASYEGVKSRTRHPHLFQGIDVALTPFPPDDPEIEARHTEAVRRSIDSSLFRAELCVDPVQGLSVRLDNFGAGHSVPSGASQDRRVWLEVHAYDDTGAEVYSSGVLEQTLQPVVELEDTDPRLVLLREKAFKADGSEAHMFWDIARTESNAIPGPTGSGLGGGEDQTFFYTDGLNVARATLTVHVRPMGLDVLGDLVESGDLDEKYLEAMPVFDMLPAREGGQEVTVEWRLEDRVQCVLPRQG